jgi:hypothetical protein
LVLANAASIHFQFKSCRFGFFQRDAQGFAMKVRDKGSAGYIEHNGSARLVVRFKSCFL